MQAHQQLSSTILPAPPPSLCSPQRAQPVIIEEGGRREEMQEVSCACIVVLAKKGPQNASLTSFRISAGLYYPTCRTTGTEIHITILDSQTASFQGGGAQIITCSFCEKKKEKNPKPTKQQNQKKSSKHLVANILAAFHVT